MRVYPEIVGKIRMGIELRLALHGVAQRLVRRVHKLLQHREVPARIELARLQLRHLRAWDGSHQ